MAGRLPLLAGRADLCGDERDPAQRRGRAAPGVAAMNFVPDPELVEFAHALREMLASADVPSTVRGWAAGDAAPGRKLWARLTEMGLAELAAEPVGLVLAFEELGRAAAPGPYVESIAV